MTTDTEARTTTQVYRVYIKATPQAIWDAITTPEWSERYGYGGRDHRVIVAVHPSVKPDMNDRKES